MRDILTVVASLMVLALAAALLVPPFVPWEAQRDAIDRALTRAVGAPAATRGPIQLRLLPSPRFEVAEVSVGDEDGASLKARSVSAEIALTPLLSGQVQVSDAQVDRVDLRVRKDPGGRVRLPAGGATVGDLVVRDLRVHQLQLTVVEADGSGPQGLFFENVKVEGQSVLGPWRVEGLAGTVPFQLSTGALGPDQALPLKLSGGGDLYPRFDVDGRLVLAGEGAPSMAGTARVLFGPPSQAASASLPLPVAVQSPFKTVGRVVEFEQLALEAGEGGASLRLTGSARVDMEAPKVEVRLEGRRLDVDSFILSPVGQAMKAEAAGWSPPLLPFPVTLDLSLGSVLLAQEELSNVGFRATLAKNVARVERAELGLAGQTRLRLEGEIGVSTQGGGNGRVSVTSAQSDRLARALGRFGLSGPLLGPLDGRPLDAAADVAVASPVAAFRNVRVKLGEAVLTGNARYTAPEGNVRGRLEAQVGLQGVDVAEAPPLTSLFEATRSLDVGLILDARGVRYGARAGAGRIAARVQSDGPALSVDSIEITDLAGASGRISGRIAPDGSGRITGRVTAPRAAPLIDLLGSVWVGGVARLTPPFLREGDLALDIVAERAAPTPTGAPRLQTTARGTIAGGLFEADVISAEGETQNLRLRLATDNTGRWVDRPDAPVLRLPSNIELRGVRVPSGRFSVTAAGSVGGVRVATTRPFALGVGDEIVDSGEADLTTPDLTPFLVLLGDGAGVQPPVPAQARVSLGRERDQTLLSISGRINDEPVRAEVTGTSRADVTGTVSVERASLPWVLNALALGAPADPRATGMWGGTRFGQTRPLIDGGQLKVQARRLDLGRGQQGEGAAFTLVVARDGVTLRDLDLRLAGGRLTGTLAVARQGALATVTGDATLRDASLSRLLGPAPYDGRLSATLRFGSSGESGSALIGNLAGAGDVRFSELTVPATDPAALERAVRRALDEPDPLALGRLQALATQELARGPLTGRDVAAPATLVGGVLRLSPVNLQAPAGGWQGSAAIDWRTLTIDARGTLSGRGAPRGWTGNAPFLLLTLRGPLTDPAREVDVGPLTNGVAAIVLQRELEKIEAFEAEANERLRVNNRRDMERARRAAQEEVARRAAEEIARRAAEEAAARRAAEEAQRRNEEAARLLRQREQEEAARQARLREERAAEEARQIQERRAREAAEAPSPEPPGLPELPAPIEVRPAPSIRIQPGG